MIPRPSGQFVSVGKFWGIVEGNGNGRNMNNEEAKMWKKRRLKKTPAGVNQDCATSIGVTIVAQLVR